MTATAEVKAKASASEVLLAEQELLNLQNRKRQVDKNLANLEIQIYQLEASYLEETSAVGNIVKGFEGYLAPSTISGVGAGSSIAGNNMALFGAGAGGATGSGVVPSSSRKRMAAARADPNHGRIFSNSSMTYQKALAMHGIIPDGFEDADLDVSGPAGGEDSYRPVNTSSASRPRSSSNYDQGFGSPMSTASSGDAEYASDRKKKKKKKHRNGIDSDF